jgi:hypothetical protein
MTAEIELRNSSERKFVDISCEYLRTYDFGGYTVEIPNPQWLHRSESGHYILDDMEVMHFIPDGWMHLTWAVKPGEPHIVV